MALSEYIFVDVFLRSKDKGWFNWVSSWRIFTVYRVLSGRQRQKKHRCVNGKTSQFSFSRILEYWAIIESGYLKEIQNEKYEKNFCSIFLLFILLSTFVYISNILYTNWRIRHSVTMDIPQYMYKIVSRVATNSMISYLTTQWYWKCGLINIKSPKFIATCASPRIHKQTISFIKIINENQIQNPWEWKWRKHSSRIVTPINSWWWAFLLGRLKSPNEYIFISEISRS